MRLRQRSLSMRLPAAVLLKARFPKAVSAGTSPQERGEGAANTCTTRLLFPSFTSRESSESILISRHVLGSASAHGSWSKHLSPKHPERSTQTLWSRAQTRLATSSRP
eukprot:4772922-Amphidinium_carterae.1